MDREASVGGVVQSVSSASTEMQSNAEAMSSTADQTNLLALNATIEAARAGDAVSDAAVTGALSEGLRLALGGSWDQGAYRSWEIEAADRLERDRYATEEWTWRR